MQLQSEGAKTAKSSLPSASVGEGSNSMRNKMKKMKSLKLLKIKKVRK